jgi:hypothetical protein
MIKKIDINCDMNESSGAYASPALTVAAATGKQVEL